MEDSYIPSIPITIQHHKGKKIWITDPALAKIVFITYENIEGLYEPAHPRSLDRTSAVGSQNTDN